MPADLKNPFGSSCCDGGECSIGGMSAMPCGCDPGAKYISPSCWLHKLKKGEELENGETIEASDRDR